MSYFIPSSLQKRLLKYALSRLDLLDTDALDLDNLQIGWGRKSTVELRDISLHRDKLAKLLYLPEKLSVHAANVGLIRVTIPADLHTSSIIIDISEVIVRLKVLEEQAPSPGDDGSSPHGPSAAFQPPATGPHADVLPTPRDLATSFLAQEPLEEREHLRAEIESRSVDLRQSSVTSSDSFEDDANQGIGLTIGLPSFLTDFFKGISDRLEISIKDVSLQLEVDIDFPAEPDQPTNQRLRLQPAALRLVASSVDIEGIISPVTADKTSHPTSPPLEKSSRDGRRRIGLHGIQCFLLLDQGPSQDLSEVFVQDDFDDPRLLFKRSTGMQLSSRASVEDEENESLEGAVEQQFEEPSTLQMFDGVHELLGGKNMTNSTYTEDSRFADAESDRGSTFEAEATTTLARSDYAAGISQSDDIFEAAESGEGRWSSNERHEELYPEISDSITSEVTPNQSATLATQTMSDVLRSMRNERQKSRLDNLSTPDRMLRFSRRPSQSTPTPGDHSGAAGSRSIAPSENFYSVDQLHEANEHSGELTNTAKDETRQEPLIDDPLAESQFFSRAEARSIYMSVLEDEDARQSARLDMPGGWNASYLSDFKAEEREATLMATHDSEEKASEKSTANVQERNATPVVTSRSPGHTWRPPDPFANLSASARTIFSVPDLSMWTPQKAGSDLPSKSQDPITSQPSSTGYAAFSNTSDEASFDIIEVECGPADVQADIPTVRALLAVWKRIQPLVAPSEQRSERGGRRVPERSGTTEPYSAPWTATLAALTVSLRASEYSEHPASSTLTDGNHAVSTDIMTLKLAKLHASTDTNNRFSLIVDKIGLDFLGESLVTFDKSASMRSSLRDLKEPLKSDLKLTHLASGRELHIDTLPVKVKCNMPKIDDALVSLGGLSWLIELGNSVALDLSASKVKKADRVRTVRFDNQSLPEVPQVMAPKINARIAGASVELTGKGSRVTFQSSAIKIVGREKLVGIQIDDMRLLTPHDDNKLESTLEARVRNTSLKYLWHPEESDLGRMIDMLTPSQDRFGDDDDFLSDTLLRQRKKGASLRIQVSRAEVTVHDYSAIDRLQRFATELSKLSVTKYFPEESRPGMLTLGLIQEASLQCINAPTLGEVSAQLGGIEFAHVGAPFLIAMRMDRLSAFDSEHCPLIQSLCSSGVSQNMPMVRMRIIGDEMEPVLKVKLYNVCMEYSTRLAMLVAGSASPEELDSSLQKTEQDRSTGSIDDQDNAPSEGSLKRSMGLSLFVRDCAVGLTPLHQNSKATFVIGLAHIGVKNLDSSTCVQLEMKKGSLLLIDDVSKLKPGDRSNNSEKGIPKNDVNALSLLQQQGHVSMAWLSVFTAAIQVKRSSTGTSEIVDIEVQNELLVLESCADSTQTMLELFADLAPPKPPSQDQKYRTEITSLEDMMASFTGDAYAPEDPVQRSQLSMSGSASRLSVDHFSPANEFDVDEEYGLDLDSIGDLTGLDLNFENDAVEDSVIITNPGKAVSQSQIAKPESEEAELEQSVIVGDVEVSDPSLPPAIEGVASKWDSSNNRYVHVSKTELSQCPLNLRIREVHIIWNLFDGYDWENTREVISNAVADVEKRAEDRRSARRTSKNQDDDEKESVIGDFLFNSIYIGIPVNHDPRELREQINRNVDDLVSETASQATVTTARPLSARGTPRPRPRRLKLERSSRHKLAFEIRGLSADVFTFPAGEETQMSADVRVRDLEIFDHVPTSTWKKFVTYAQDAGPREEKKPMIHIQVCDVRPVPELTASELVIRATVLPLRLHIDQDALDFLTRFFEFKTEAARKAASSTQKKEQPYLQRVEVLPVPVVLDYKPKKVDFAGLRSGRTTEFMNFFILDAARMTLRHAIIYGCSGMDKLHKSLEDVWMPDIKRNQLPSILSGLNGVRTLVNVGAGVRDLVVVPIQEYRKDGRIVRSVRKGAVAFARGAGGELTRFGAKLAVGAQGFLQNAEEYLVARPSSSAAAAGAEGSDWEDAAIDAHEKRAISAYASQPTGILQGLKGAAKSLERDLLTTRDVLIAVSGEVRDGGGIGAIASGAPTLVLRPMIGVSKAVGLTLMGATNTVDPESRRRLEDKYKKY